MVETRFHAVTRMILQNYVYHMSIFFVLIQFTVHRAVEATWQQEEEPKQRAEKFYLDKPRLLLATTLSVYIVDRAAALRLGTLLAAQF